MDDSYQNSELAQKALYLRTHIRVLQEEVEEFRKMVEESDAPADMKSWLRRVHGNTSKYFRPVLNNLDQVRYILDHKGAGLSGGEEE